MRLFLRNLKNLFIDHVIFFILLTSKKFNKNKYDKINFENKGIILFNTQYHWYHSWIDYTLAAGLQYRGFKIIMLLCDGLTYCEQKTISIERPNCIKCYKNTSRKANFFKIDTIKISELLSSEDKKINYNLAYNLSIETLTSLVIKNIKIGLYSLRNFTHYNKGVVEVKTNQNLFRNIIESALNIQTVTDKILNLHKINKIITPNGKFIQSSIAIDCAKNNKIDFYTWDFFNQGGFTIFSKNDIAHDQHIGDVWNEIKDKDITNNQKNQVINFFNLQAKSLNTPFKYYDSNIIEDHSRIKNELKLTLDSYIITIFTNVEWDSTAMGQDLAYVDMFDWVKSMIDYAMSNNNFTLIIRSHPGESKVPKDLQTRTPVVDRINNFYSKLTPNIKIIKPLDNISSYELAKMSDVSIVYTSTLGLEFALMGIRPWVAASPYYTNKGFTFDIKSHSEVISALNNFKFNNKLNFDEVSLAIRFAYAIKFRKLFNFYPIYNNKGKFLLFKYGVIDSKESDGFLINNICNFIDDKTNSLDLGFFKSV